MAATTTTFHRRTGSLVTLSNDNKTAQRNHPAQEFNNGVVLSEEPLKENQLFEVKIDRKVNSWSGSIEIGITTSDPTNLNFPTSATGFREGTWVMSGCSILKDGHTTMEEYGQDLDQLAEGDRVGVLRTTAGALHFYVNGIDQGPAAPSIPSPVYAVVDMYGKCAQVTIVDDVYRDMVICNDITNEAIVEASLAHSNERLVFHEHCGTLVKLTNGRRSGERRRPLDEFNNGVVMTNRPLKNDELFEIRIDRLVDKWSGSIEVGITTHNPSRLDFPATMTNMRSGTVMMSGCGILTNGKGTRREYGSFNLDELQEGDRIGLIRKSSGALHYYINGQDQGVAATRTPEVIWGVVDLYGMAVKVTILDSTDASYPADCEMGGAVATPRVSNNAQPLNRESPAEEEDDDNSSEGVKLVFHSHCGSNAAVIGNLRTAHRPDALEHFNNGVVLTDRHLRPGELFEVRLDKIVDKWAGSIEIGVTTHSATELMFPSTMTNVRSGTWMMTGNGVMHNGTTVIDDYGRNLDHLKEGDRVGVVRRVDGSLQFTVNGVDQGIAATNVPANVYGVIDLYGQAAEATIVDSSDPRPFSDLETVIESNPEELMFHHLHGRNATISPNGKTASRPNARGEFNDAIIMSNRPLRDNELFEVTIDIMVDRWSGSIEAGVTLIHPEDLEFPNTMTDIDYDTWMLSGSAIMQDGSTIRSGYHLDLDNLVAGSRIGMMRCSDGTLHFHLDGEDQGVACTDLPSGVYAVIDLYGQCAQVTLTSGSGVRSVENHTTPKEVDQTITSPITVDTTHRFSQCCGKNVVIKNNGCTATRMRGDNHGLVFSVDPLRADELFEIKLDQLAKQWAGSLQIGLTTMVISDNLPLSILPSTATDLRSKVTWVVSGSEVMKNGVTIKENYGPSLERLQVDDKIGVKWCIDGTMHIYVNGEDLGVAASGVPRNSFALVDLYGEAEQITVTSSAFAELLHSSHRPPSVLVSENSESIEEEQDRDTAEPCYMEFHSNHGKNIQLSEHRLVASRTASYNQGIVISHKPLPRNHVFSVRLDKLNSRWSASLLIGVVGFQPDKSTLPVSALNIKKSSWIVFGDSVFQSGVKIKETYGPNLDGLQTGHIIGIMIDDENALHLYVNGVDQGIAAREIPSTCYALVDLYGQCEQIAIATGKESGETVHQATEYKEKAVMEDGIKEKIHRSLDSVVKNCEFQNMCSRFKASLGLPDGYFNSENNRCYCETCHKVRGDEPYFKVGEPPMDYALPFGWCKFGLRMPPKAELTEVFEKWHIAYHGGKVTTVRKVLDSGDLLAQASSLTTIGSGWPYTDGKNRPDEPTEAKPMSLSPSVRYAACLLYAPRYEFKDPKTKKTQYARVSFQVRVKPGSYRVGAQTIGANEQIDPKFHNNEVEWSARDRSSLVLSALLFKIEQ